MEEEKKEEDKPEEETPQESKKKSKLEEMKETIAEMKEATKMMEAANTERAKVVEELLNELKKYISEGDYLLVYEGIPLIHFLTKTKPYLDNPWVDLYRLDIFLKKFEHALKQRPILPVIVRAKANTSTETWPKGIVSTLSQKNRYVQKRPIWDKFVTSNQYSIVWENDFFEILITGIN